MKKEARIPYGSGRFGSVKFYSVTIMGSSCTLWEHKAVFPDVVGGDSTDHENSF